MTLFRSLSLLAALLTLAPPALANKPKAAAVSNDQLMADVTAGKDLFATIDTTLGTIVLKLDSKDAPKTVGNFVGLATGAKTGKPFYDGLIFHRVIPNFMAQGGDPQGTGMGDPGYKFADENQHSIDKAGILAMANAGPNTNGSQFFITEVPQPRLATYNVFGEVVTGLDVVVKITHTPTAPGDRPLTPVVMNKVTISETAPKAK